MAELEAMAQNRQMAVDAFGREYVRQVDGRLALRERFVNGEHFCCFFDSIDQRCTIYNCRPKQCREFPFWDEFKNHPEFLSDCPGVILK